MEQQPAKGHRTHVTVMFADLCDYTAFSERTEPEEAEALRRQVEKLAVRIVHAHRGVITQCYGDGILAVFGLPLPTEDDARRAVDAALELHEAARALTSAVAPEADFEVRLHSGIHAGLVFVRMGDTLHGKYDITGDTINTAARLAGAAGRDEVLVSGDTLRGLEAFFATDPTQELKLKGKRATMLVQRVKGRSDVQTRYEARVHAGLTPFVGRTHELARLLEQLEKSRLSEGQIAVVGGAAGIGKTRLVQEFRERVSSTGVLVVTGNCDSYGEMPPLEPFLQILRQIFGIQRDTSAKDASAAVQAKLDDWSIGEHSNVFLRLLSLTSRDPQADRRPVKMLSAFRALARLIEAVSQRFSVLMILDDWQWADSISQRVLTRIASNIAHRPVDIVVGLRDGAHAELKLNAGLVIQLEPFRMEESRQVIGGLRDRDLDVGLTSALHERSGGNPLYLEELCSSLTDDVRGAQALEHDAIPNTLHGLIQARTSRLSESQMQILQRASVIGVEFSTALLASGTGEPPAATDLAALQEDGLIYAVPERNTFRFKHGITREVVYGSVILTDRLRIHHEIARALAHQVAADDLIDQSEALAFHYHGSADHERAATYAELSGDKAATSSFLEAARLHYESALSSLDRITLDEDGKRRWLRICAKWAAQGAYGASRSQLALLERADAYARDLKDDVARAHNCHMLAWFHYLFGDYAQSLRHGHESLELAERTGDVKLRVQLWTSLGQVYGVSGRYEEALEYLNRGIEQKRARTSDAERPARRTPAVLYAHALTLRAMVYAYRGACAEADENMREALAIVSGTGHAMEASVLSHQSIIDIRRGKWEAALDTARRCCRLAERLNSNYVFGISSAFASYSLWRLKPSATFLADIRRAVGWLEAREFGLYISFAYGCLAEALCESGDTSTARDYAGRALARAEAGDPQGDIAAHRVMACAVYAERADAPEVDTWLAQALETAATRESLRERALTSLCCAQLGRSPGGGWAIEPLDIAATIATFEQMDMPWYAALARRVPSI